MVELGTGRQWARLTAKFTTLAEPVLGSERTAAVIQRVAALETLARLDELTALTDAGEVAA